MSEVADACDVRQYRDGDKAFIMATFLRGLYYGDSWFSLIPKDIFMENYKRVAEALLVHPSTGVRVACLREDPDVILGYCVHSTVSSTAHWMFVKAAWRKQGIARKLLPFEPTTVSHLTAAGKSLVFEKFPNCVFNPFSVGG